MSIWLGVALLIIVVIIAAFIIYITFFESDRWVRTSDPNVIDLIERLERMPKEKVQELMKSDDD